MQAIYTRYYGPTNFRGSRIVAFTSGYRSARADGRKALAKELRHSQPYDHSADQGGNHMMAAKALAERLNWEGLWSEGEGPDGRGFVYVCSEGADSFRIGDAAINRAVRG